MEFAPALTLATDQLTWSVEYWTLYPVALPVVGTLYEIEVVVELKPPIVPAVFGRGTYVNLK
jgi:hypothetical protein